MQIKPEASQCHFSFDFYVRKQLLLSACLNHCNSVCPSHRWISQKRYKL